MRYWCLGLHNAQQWKPGKQDCTVEGPSEVGLSLETAQCVVLEGDWSVDCAVQGLRKRTWWLRLHNAQRETGWEAWLHNFWGQGGNPWTLWLRNAQSLKAGIVHCAVPRGRDACLRLATTQCAVQRGWVSLSWSGKKFSGIWPSVESMRQRWN